MDIPMILTKIRPGAVWSISENRYETLDWKDDSPKPSYQEVVDAWDEVEIEIHNQKMEVLRQTAYQKESDPIFFRYQRGSAEKFEWLDKVQEIKDRYPYSASSQA